MKTNINIVLLYHHPYYLTLRPYNVGLYLSQRGYNISLILPCEKSFSKPTMRYINSRYTVYSCPTLFSGRYKKGADPLDLISRLSLLSRLDYDIVFAFDSRPTVILPALYGKFLRGVPLIIDWTDWFGRGGTIAERSGFIYRFVLGRIETFFEEYFRGFADSSTVICRPLEKRLRNMGYKKRVMYWPLGCQPRSEIDLNEVEGQQKLKLPKRKPLIGQVGTLFRSDAKLFFESYKLVKEKMDADLILIGTNNFEGSYEIPGDVLTTGKLSYDELLSYLSCCDIGAMPLKNNIANNGRWPSKLNDYLTAGVPIVATEISVVEELLKDCTFGETAKDNPIDFANKIVEMLSDRGKLRIYGENASKFAKNKLSWPKLIEELDMFLQETLEEHKAKLRLRL